MPEPGETESCGSQINIDFRREFSEQDPRNAFAGSVSSANRSCEQARPVVVKKVKRGPDTVVGRTVTNAKGKYKVFERNPRGRFYAKVKKSEGTAGGAPILCLGDRSKTITIR
jgi:hypothetical protein